MPTLCERKDLSIIVPVYNLENYIQPLLDSFKSQELGQNEVEFIFVMNNCTDRSEAIIRESGIGTIINCDEQGCGPARNKGMEIAKGEYIWFIDGDDWLLSDTAIKDALDKAQGHDIIRIPFRSKTFYWQYFSMVWQYVMRKDFIEEFKFPSIQPQEDDVFMDMVLRKAGLNRWMHMALPSVDKPLYWYNYMREGSNMYRIQILHEQI